MVALSEFIPGEAIALYDCWCDRQAFRKRSLIIKKNLRSHLRVVGDRSVSNHRIVMVEMDKIVSEKRGWVNASKPNL